MLGGTSACRSVYEYRDILDTYPWFQCIPSAIRAGVRQGILPFGGESELERDLGEHLLRVMAGKETPEQALEIAQERLNRLNR